MNGILTTNDYQKQKNLEDRVSEKTNPIPINKNVKIEYKYFFPPSPKGQSSTQIDFMGEKVKIKMTDGVFFPPKNWSRTKLEAFHIHIQTLGFENMSKVLEKKEQKKKEVKKLEYLIGHPDNTKDNSVNGNVSIIVNGKDKKFTCKDGIIKTKDKIIFDAFIEKGWYQVDIKEIKDKEKMQKNE